MMESQARLYREPTLEDRRMFKIWYDSIRKTGLTLEQTIAEEVAEYFGESVDHVIDYWYYSTEKLKDEWNALSPTTDEEIINFYDSNITYIYELSYWHTLHMNLGLIENVRSLEKAINRPGRRYLDFGGGTGSNIILFSTHGFDCTLADISTSMLDFANWRFINRGIDCSIVDLKESLLPEEYYDFVTAVEVLEHVKNPVDIMQKIVKVTKPGGIIVAWVPFYADELRPMHLVNELSVADNFVSDLGLVEVWRDEQMMIRHYQKPM